MEIKPNTRREDVGAYYMVIDRESGLVVGTDLTLAQAVALRDALTTLGDPVVVSGRLAEGSNVREGS